MSGFGGMFGSYGGGGASNTATTSAPAASSVFGGTSNSGGASGTTGGGLFADFGGAGITNTGTLFSGGSGATNSPFGGGAFGGGGGAGATKTGAGLGGGAGAANTGLGGMPGGFGGVGGVQKSQLASTAGGGFALGGNTSQADNKNGLGSMLGGFGGGALSTANNNSEQAGGGLFSNANNNNAQAGNGGFGVQSNNAQQQQGSLLGLSGQPSNIPNTSSYFNSILEKNRKRALGDRGDEDIPQLQLGLGDIRQRMKRFAPDRGDGAVDGRAHYLLAGSGVDPGAAIRDLNNFNATTRRTERAQLQPFDAPDTDVEGYLANMQTQTTLNMIADGLARSVKDFDNFLEENVNMEWDAQRQRIYQHFGIKATNQPGAAPLGRAALTAETGAFGRSRRSKTGGLAASRATGNGKPPLGTSTFGKSSLQKSVIGVNGPIGGGFQPVFADIEKRIETIGIAVPDPSDRFHREREAQLAKKVQHLNFARLQKTAFPILHEFASTTSEGGEEHSQAVLNAYKVLIEIVGEDPEVTRLGDARAVKERTYAKDYLSDMPNARKTMDLKRRILRGSTRHLEKIFYETIEDFVAKNPKDAGVGGVPSVLGKVKGFVRLKGARRDLAPDNSILQDVNGDYAWAVVFYLLRSGKMTEARTYVQENMAAFSTIDHSFHQYIVAYEESDDRVLPQNLRTQINNAYTQRLRIAPENSIDPFRMACYKVIGRCDVRNRHFEGLGHSQAVDDFIWLQFAMAREVNPAEELASEVYNLAELQDNVRLIGARYFQKDEQHGMHFYLQILAGLFEDAVAFIYPHSTIDAVHIAIALDFYGLLHVADPSVDDNNLITVSTRGAPQLKFGHMVGYYTRGFRAANPTAAIDYLSLICLNKDVGEPNGNRQVLLCHEALRELVLESREFALLLGDIRADGQRIKGVIEERMRLIGLQDGDEYMRTITIQAAGVADDNGRTTDAVLLYHLAQEYDNVLTVINRSLSEAVCVPIGQEQMRLQPLKPRTALSPQDRVQMNSLSLTAVDDPVQLAQNMMALYRLNGQYKENIKESNWRDCEALLKMSEARVCVSNQQWGQALDLIEELGILPIKARGNASLIRNYATKFASLSPPLASALPNILTWAIGCTSSQLAQTGGVYGGNDGTRQLFVEQLRQDTMDLTTYTSQLRYRFPPSVHEMLARAQSH
ncbi:Nup93/Nic96-domain-containing protein [Calycina marina]|uniref:Nup93/Nic96-domain-containing protein n=1 Tax=Calycina marina TaxID=1763456 RepID=A0A9P7Z4C7_9HELO|nr:Nup93/Nic96-domain-containing protein [Calycina marina]